MKTTMSLRKATRTSFIALIIFAAPATSFTFGNPGVNDPALDRVELLNNHIEKSLRYVAPEEAEVLCESESSVSEAVDTKLEWFNSAIEESLKYRAPEESEDIKEYEMEQAMSCLDNFFLAVEESIKF